MMKTYSPKAKEITRTWHVIDAAGIPLGRLASRVAQLLRGKHKPTFAPHLDTGDHVIVVNAEQIALTGDKINQKMYYRHSGYPGGFRATPVKDELARRPIRVIERAVKGMLPHTALGKQQLTKLKVYPGPDHPHAGQVNPGPGKVKTRRLSETTAPAGATEPTATDDLATDATVTGVTSTGVTSTGMTAATAVPYTMTVSTASPASASDSPIADVSERQTAAAASDREDAEAANPTDAPLGEPTEAGSTPTETTPGEDDATDVATTPSEVAQAEADEADAPPVAAIEEDDVRTEASGPLAATARDTEEATS